MVSAEAEGVRKYRMRHDVGFIELAGGRLNELNRVRDEMRWLGLVGQDPGRYDGAGFGNLSFREADGNNAFIISGSQTGGMGQLGIGDLAVVTSVDISANSLISQGGREPSSEAMTHAVFYQSFPDIGAVIHVHSPLIWRQSQKLGLAATAADVPYGTPAMAQAIKALAGELRKQGKALVFVMAGHEDGVIAAAGTLAQCAGLLVDLVQRAEEQKMRG